jgi:hypothetical protein
MDLAQITMTAGVNNDGDPFVTVAATSKDRKVMLAQLDPDEVRGHALIYLEVAEAAQQDAAVLRVIRRLDLPDGLAGAVVMELRKMRAAGLDAEETP